MKELIDVIDLISTHYLVQIGVNGSLIGTFEHIEDIPYRYLHFVVNCIYPGIVTMKGEKTSTEKAVIRLDLVSV